MSKFSHARRRVVKVGAALVLAAGLTAGSSIATTVPALADKAPLSVTTQPSDVSVQVGANAVFSADSDGNNGTKVQWYACQSACTSDANWSEISGATSKSLTLTGVTQDMNGRSYRAKFTHDANTSLLTNSAILTVTPAPVPSVTSNPADASVTVGTTATFTAAASGNPTPTVQWQVSTDGSTWTNVSGATSTTLNVPTTMGLNGSKYQAVFTNSQGSKTTSAATLTVNKATPSVSGNTPSTATAGDQVTVTATLAGGFEPTGTVTFELFANGNCAALPVGTKTVTVNNASASADLTLEAAGAYSWKLSYSGDDNNGGAVRLCPPTQVAEPAPAQTAPTITTHPASITKGAGDTVEFGATATGNPVPTVQWQVCSSRCDRPSAHWTNVSDGASTTLTLSNVTTGMNGNKYRAVFTNTAGTATSTAATLTVTSGPTITNQPDDATTLAGLPAVFSALAQGVPAPSVQWEVSTDGRTDWSEVAGATGNRLILSSVTQAMNGNVYRAVFTGAAGSVTSDPATLTVWWAPEIVHQPADQTAWAGENATFTSGATGNPAPSVQWWTYKDHQVCIPFLGCATVTLPEPIPGATNATFTVNDVAADMDGSRYFAVFTNAAAPFVAKTNTVTLHVRSVTVTAPAALQFTAIGECDTHGSLTQPETEGVTYSIGEADWTVDRGSHTITATPGEGYRFDASTLPEGWHLGEDGGATYLVDLGEFSECNENPGGDENPGGSQTPPAVDLPDALPNSTGELHNVPANTEPGQVLTDVWGEGFAPGAPVTFGIYSTPTTLATVTADATGRASATIAIPAGFGGSHTVVAAGTGANGQPHFPQAGTVVATKDVGGVSAGPTGGADVGTGGSGIAGVAVGPKSGVKAPLAATGAPVAGLGQVALLALLAGTTLLLVARRRPREH